MNWAHVPEEATGKSPLGILKAHFGCLLWVQGFGKNLGPVVRLIKGSWKLSFRFNAVESVWCFVRKKTTGMSNQNEQQFKWPQGPWANFFCSPSQSSFFSRLQTECSHYRTIAEEAYKHLTEILQRDVLSQSLNVRLTDWLELMEEVFLYTDGSKLPKVELNASGTVLCACMSRTHARLLKRKQNRKKICFQIKNKVPASLNQEGWENQTILRLQEQLNQVNKLGITKRRID